QPQKRHGVWTCPTCKHQPFSPLGLPPRIPKHHQQQPPTSPRKATGGGGGGGGGGGVDLIPMPPKDALQPGAKEERRLEVAAASPIGESNGAVAAGVPMTSPPSPSKGGGGGGGGSDGNPAAGGRNRSASVGSGYSVGDGGGDGGSCEVSRRTGRQRVAKKFGDEFDEIPLFRKSASHHKAAAPVATPASEVIREEPNAAAYQREERDEPLLGVVAEEEAREAMLTASGGAKEGGEGEANGEPRPPPPGDGPEQVQGRQDTATTARDDDSPVQLENGGVVEEATKAPPVTAVEAPAALAKEGDGLPRGDATTAAISAASRSASFSSFEQTGATANGTLSPMSVDGDKAGDSVFTEPKREAGTSAAAAATGAPGKMETGVATLEAESQQQRSPPASPSLAPRENGAKPPDAKARAAAGAKKGGSGSSGRKSSGSSPAGKSGGGGSAAGSVGESPKAEVVPAEKNLPRVKVPRAELLGAVVARLAIRRSLGEEEGDAGLDGGGGGSGSCDEMSESDSGEEEEGRRTRRKGTKDGEATVVREAVVSAFDEIEGRYVLVNTHEEEERLTLEELEVALQQSQVLYGCAERMLPLSPSELEKVRDGELDASAAVTPPAEDTALAGSGAGGSGGGYGTSGDTLDSKSLGLASLLRRKSYAVFTPAERARLLRGLCDLAVSTSPIKEHLQLLQERVLRLETEAMASEKQASSMSERQRFEGDIGPSIKSPRRSQDFSCTHPERKHYARGLCVSCYQR
ncbi:unnamed protein product, partial [Ectocarpus sp. 13 AM-2016]